MQTEPSLEELSSRVYSYTDHGASPYGGSYWNLWRECGRKATLKAAEKAKGLVILDDEDAGDISNDKLQMFRVGLYFHSAQEFCFLRGLRADEVIWPENLAGDVNFREAVRLFLAYAKHWGSPGERFGGRMVGAEVALGEKDPETIKRILGGYYTGRADAIIEVTDPAACLRNTGLALMPGRYILDYKTSKAWGTEEAEKEKFGSRNLQAASYLWLDALERGEEGAVGVIFDRAILHKVLDKEKSYGAFVAYPQMDTEERLRSLIAVGLRNQANPLPDQSACVSGWGGEVCWFKRSGACPGY